MITAMDTNVLLDVFGANPEHGERSKASLRRCAKEGALLACDVVWAEVSAFFPSQSEAQEAMERLGIGYSFPELESALEAGFAWKEYRRRGGTRKRLVADFFNWLPCSSVGRSFADSRPWFLSGLFQQTRCARPDGS